MASIPTIVNAGSGRLGPITTSQTQLKEAGRADTPVSSALDSAAAAVEGNTPISHAELERAVSQANKTLAGSTSNQLEFSVDEVTGAYVIKLIDLQTGKTLRQYPSEKMLAISQAIMNLEGGSLISQKV